jgi:hypothetical protein
MLTDREKTAGIGKDSLEVVIDVIGDIVRLFSGLSIHRAIKR